MRGLPLAELRLSGELAIATPAALAQRAVAQSAAARVLEQRVGVLTSLTHQMQSGSWVSPAGAAFLETAGEQIRRVTIAAALLDQLASALGLLAASLAAARETAVAVIARSRQLDGDVAAFNHRLGAQHALRPQDPDSLLVSGGGESAALTAQAQALSTELAGAELDARRAWQRAQASFDVAGYGSPAQQRRMTSAPWDPASSVSLAAAGSLGTVFACGPMDDLSLPTNGRLKGPDGRSYELVVQTSRSDDGRLLVSTQEQPADRVGWSRLAVRFGTTAYGHKAAMWEKIAVALGGAAGAAYPEGSTFAPSLLGELKIMPGGGAYLPSLPSEPGGTVKEAPAEAPRGKEAARYWVAPTNGLASGRKASTPDGIGLLDAGISGFLLARRLDDGRAADYRVVFEESPTGVRRARLQLYRVVAAPGSAPTTAAAGGYVDSRGRLAGIPVTGEPSNGHPIITEAGH